MTSFEVRQLERDLERFISDRDDYSNLQHNQGHFSVASKVSFDTEKLMKAREVILAVIAEDDEPF